MTLPATLASEMASTNAGEAVVVLKSSITAGSQCGLWRLSSSGYYSDSLYPASDGSISEGFGVTDPYGGPSGLNLGVPAQPLTQYHVYEVSAQSNNWSAWINGQLLYHTSGNTYLFNYCNVVLGNDYYGGFVGDIAEVMYFNRALTVAERTAVDAYLNGKYGLVPTVPIAPTNLVALAVATNQISLTWQESLNQGATRVSIERKTGTGGTYAEIAELTSAISYVDTNLTAETTYYYRARAINLTTWSAYSNETNATTLASGASMPFGNLVLWLKADSGLAQISTNTAVSYWVDQSGKTNNASQPTAAGQPAWIAGALNGYPVVRFSGSQSMTLPATLASEMASTNAGEAVVVLKSSITAGSQCGLWRLSSSGYYSDSLYPASDGSISEGFGVTDPYGGPSGLNLGVPAQPLTQYHVYEVSAQSNNWSAWINGQLLYHTSGNTYLFNYCNVVLGNDYYGGFVGDIAEVMYFNRALTVAERTAVDAYLNGKYGLVPIVSITTPTNQQAFISPANIQIDVTATDKRGIQQVEFFNGSQSLGIVTNEPYSIIWSNITSGYYALTAVALNDAQRTTTSDVVNIAVDIPPQITITVPISNSFYLAGTNVDMQAWTYDADGTIAQVQFFAGSTSLGIITNSSYKLTWTNAIAGSYALTAVAKDNDGLTTTSSVVSILVDAPPSVTLTNPVNGAFFIIPTNLILNANASDSDGTIKQVQFFAGNNNIGTITNAPYNLTWSNVPPGIYALTAQTIDNYGVVSTSPVVNITVAGVTVTSPTNYLVLTAPGSISLSATVADNVGISQVQYFQGTTSLGVATSAPYPISWNSISVGTYQIIAQATDVSSRILSSGTVNLIVDTSPSGTDRDGDGVSDYIEYLEGRNPLVSGVVPDTNNVINLQIYTPLH